MSGTILFVDDDADDREVLAEMIKEVSPGVNAVFAENGLQALKYLAEQKQAAQLPCLVVLDLNMPYLDGRETLKRIREELNLGELPVIIFTSSQSPNDRSLFSSMGVEFITKPYTYSRMPPIVMHMSEFCKA